MKKIFIAIVIVFVILQFFQINKINPITEPSKDLLVVNNTSADIASLVKTSCYDCHSNQTNYPYYSYLQPIGWFLKNHIDEGRNELNFSTFADYDLKKQDHKLEECIELIEKNEMPLSSYTIIHNQAKLDQTKKNQLIEYFKKIRTELN